MTRTDRERLIFETAKGIVDEPGLANWFRERLVRMTIEENEQGRERDGVEGFHAP